MKDCPNRVQLERLLAKGLEDAERDQLELHVEDCAACQHELELLTAAMDSEPPLTATMDLERRHAREAHLFTAVPGARVGPYTLLEQIGEGGMGTVYRAAQEKPVRRQVALKIIKPGMGSDQAVRRFDAERQALALMDHPGIAKVFDAGNTVSGGPYFVMELVDGIPITDYCDQARLTTKERLDLFIPVCQAIQHAHQKGIIHRDVKPSNVLVAAIDGKPLSRVIDFGVAKAIDQRLIEGTVSTQHGAILGTFEYMSPEQAGLSGLDVDARSDIYSLGAMLYELITGSTPLKRAHLGDVDHGEILRRIKEDEPPKPSKRLSGSGDELTSIAQQRRTEPNRLTRMIAGDLDWIVMMALEKDRSRRYETASGFARDVQRFLDGDPVEACPPTAAYRLGKFARKHRAAMVTAGLFAAMLLLMSAVSGWAAIRATTAERQARSDRDRAREAEAQARSEADHAMRSASESEAVRKFVESDLLAAARPEGQMGGLGRDVTLRQAVDAAQPKIARAFKDQPTIEAAVRNTLGLTYHCLGEYASAIAQLERALELRKAVLSPNHPDTFQSLNNLALAYLGGGRTADAIALREEILKLKTAQLGPDHPDTLTGRDDLALIYQYDGRMAEASSLRQETLKRRSPKVDSDRHSKLTIGTGLALDGQAAGGAADAIAMQEATLSLQILSLGRDHPDTLNGRSNLVAAYVAARRPDKAIALGEETLKLVTSRFGQDHPNALTTRNNLANAYRDAGRTAEAITMHEETLRLSAAKLGPDHPNTLITRNNLAMAYTDVGRAADAIALQQETFKLASSKLGPNHPNTLASRVNLALAYKSGGRTAEAIAMHEQTLKLRTDKLGPEHPSTLSSRVNLAFAYKSAGRTDEAIAMYEETLKLMDPRLGSDHPDTLLTRHNLAAAYQAARRSAEAIVIWDAILPAVRKTFGSEHAQTLSTTSGRAASYESLGHWAAVEHVRREVAATRRKLSPSDSLALAGDLTWLGLNLFNQRKWVEAEPVLRESLKIRETKQPDDWMTFNTRSLLGGTLLGQRKYAEAEPLVAGGYEGIKTREARIPASSEGHLSGAADRVVKLYEAWGKPEKVAEWRKRLGLVPQVPVSKLLR